MINLGNISQEESEVWWRALFWSPHNRDM